MSREAVKSVVLQMLNDEEFRTKLLTDPEGTVREGGFDISEKELEAFKNISNEDLTNLSPEELEERLSKEQVSLTIAGTINVSSNDMAAY